jgi:hypothetical protein
MLAEMIVGHMVGDYLLQNHWMALNKKKASLPCAVHCLVWTLAVATCSGCWSLLPLFWLFATHFAIDRSQFIHWYMGHAGQAGFRDNMGPWSSIVVDNAFHLLTLLLATKML